MIFHDCQEGLRIQNCLSHCTQHGQYTQKNDHHICMKPIPHGVGFIAGTARHVNQKFFFLCYWNLNCNNMSFILFMNGVMKELGWRAGMW